MAVNLPSAIPSLPKTQSDDWVRPSDWPVITDTPGEIWALVNDQGSGYISFTAVFTGTAYVDWGDGSSPVTITSNVPFTKFYTAGTGTPCSRGYTTFKVRIYGGTFTSCRPTYQAGLNSVGISLGARYSIGLLEMYYGDGVGVGTGGSYFSSNQAPNSTYTFNQLEYVKYPATQSSINMTYQFANCYSLQKVVLPTYTGAATSLVQAFQNCYKLKSIEFPATFDISSLNNTFTGCYSLKSVKFNQANLNSCSTMASAFNQCYNLLSLDLPPMSSCQTYTSMCNLCHNLRYVNFKPGSMVFGTETAVTMTGMFLSCASLEQVNLAPITNALISGGTMFSGCSSLKYVNLPDGYKFASLNQAFNGCSNLQKVEFQHATFSMVDATSAFQNCYNLVDVKLPATASSWNAATMFSGCQSLGTFSSSLPFTSLSSTFNGCSNLKSVTLTNGNSMTFLISTFANCYELVDVNLPPLPSATLFTTIFQNCASLQYVTFPTNYNNTNSTGTNPFTGMFNGCSSLRGVTFSGFGTRVVSGSVGIFNAMFNNCASLQQVDMSPWGTMTFNNNAGDSTNSMFAGCQSLKSIKYTFVPGTGAGGTQQILSNIISNSQSLEDFDGTNLYPTATNYFVWTNNSTNAAVPALKSATFSCRFFSFANNGAAGATYSLENLRLLSTATGQYGGSSPQVNVSYTRMGKDALNQLFTDLPTITAKTINITGCPGAVDCNRTIATAKGWTVTG